MMQEWSQPAGSQQHYERLLERWEDKLRANFPILIGVYGRDFFDAMWPERGFEDDDETEAFEEAVRTVSAELANTYTFRPQSIHSETGDE
jgi:hypothetical protein